MINFFSVHYTICDLVYILWCYPISIYLSLNKPEMSFVIFLPSYLSGSYDSSWTLQNHTNTPILRHNINNPNTSIRNIFWKSKEVKMVLAYWVTGQYCISWPGVNILPLRASKGNEDVQPGMFERLLKKEIYKLINHSFSLQLKITIILNATIRFQYFPAAEIYTNQCSTYLVRDGDFLSKHTPPIAQQKPVIFAHSFNWSFKKNKHYNKCTELI